MQLFRKGLIVRGESQIKRYTTTENDECWWPVGQSIVLAKVGEDQVQFSQDITLIRVTPISEVADGLFDGDLAFRLTTENTHDIFGKNLDMFAVRAWKKFNAQKTDPAELHFGPDATVAMPGKNDWHCYVFMTIFEIDDKKPDTEPPTFRGYLPMDERLLTIATSEDFWIG